LGGIPIQRGWLFHLRGAAQQAHAAFSTHVMTEMMMRASGVPLCLMRQFFALFISSLMNNFDDDMLTWVIHSNVA